MQFVPASGKRTTITEIGPADEPETSRRGTKGFSETVRAGRTFSVLVRGLKAAAEKVVVTNDAARKEEGRQGRRRPLSTPVTEAELDFELDQADLMFGEAIDTKTDARVRQVRPARSGSRS